MKNSDNINNKKKQGTRWLFFWENIIIPINIITGTIALVQYFNIFTLLSVVLFIVTVIGLKRRKLWGWYLNFIILLIATVNYPLHLHAKRVSNWESKEILIRNGVYERNVENPRPKLTVKNSLPPLATIGIIMLPNTIYFLKRKKLFQSKNITDQ